MIHSNLACGIGSQIWGGLTALVSWFAYTLIADSLSLVQWWSGSIVDWIVAVLAIDLSYYWFHRISHRVRLFWSFHVVHHQSESYNLSVALRQSWFGGFLSWIFYTPWLIVGLPPTALVVAKLINLLYQYWIHTRLIGQLPFGLEWIMSSPVESPCSSRAGRSISRYELWRYFYCLGSNFWDVQS